jgi:hypothetical protein
VHSVPSLDLYRELEVDPSATPETIEAAWRSLVKRHHPDVARDRVAAVEKIKRLNLAHEWLADRRLREMYDLTQMRRRHAKVTLEDGPGTAASAAGHSPAAARMTWRVGGRTLPPALVSTAAVAILVAAALGSIALYQPPAPSGALAAGPNDGPTPAQAIGSVAQATSRPPASTASPLPAPAFERDMPRECSGLDRTISGQSAGREARLLFLQCSDSRTFGPLVYARDGTSWTRVASGKMEGAIPLAAGFGSMTGASDEYWVAWTTGNAESWLVVYEIRNAAVHAIWHSLQAGLPAWHQAEYEYVANIGPRGVIQVRFTDPDTGRCETCPGQRYLEMYEWIEGDMTQVHRNPI